MLNIEDVHNLLLYNGFTMLDAKDGHWHHSRPDDMKLENDPSYVISWGHSDIRSYVREDKQISVQYQNGEVWALIFGELPLQTSVIGYEGQADRNVEVKIGSVEPKANLNTYNYVPTLDDIKFVCKYAAGITLIDVGDRRFHFSVDYNPHNEQDISNIQRFQSYLYGRGVDYHREPPQPDESPLTKYRIWVDIKDKQAVLDAYDLVYIKHYQITSIDFMQIMCPHVSTSCGNNFGKIPECESCSWHKPLEAFTYSASTEFHGWQLCPKCNGDGDLFRYNSPPLMSTNSRPICDVCNGLKIISIVTGLPPGNAR